MSSLDFMNCSGTVLSLAPAMNRIFQHTTNTGAKAMRILKIVVFLGILTMSSLFAGVPAASADDTICRGTLGAVTVDNLVVPDRAKCTLEGTRVEGNVFVQTRGVLVARGIHVDGNIQAEGARNVRVLASSFVGGSIQIKQGQQATVTKATINGDLQVESNSAYIVLRGNRIGGNLQAFQNTGGLEIVNNRIAQNLQCKENNPPPTGSGNRAGSKEDQCAGL
jgi:hypothetical protein